VKKRLTITTAATALALTALLAACNPQDGSAPAADSARQGATPAATPSDGVRRVSIADARAMAERGEAVIYDVRDRQAFEAHRVRGAKLVPLGEVAARAAEFPKDKLVITYCA